MAKKGIKIDMRPTRRFADEKGLETPLAKNHDASKKRSMKKLRQLLCEKGERSDGRACVACESKCQFGIEYMKRQEINDVQSGE